METNADSDSNRSTQSNPNLVGASPDRVVPSDITAVLFEIADRADTDNRVNVEDISDDAYMALTNHKLITLLPDGTLTTTAIGNKVIDKRILKVYPMVPNNTAAGYNRTFNTMTASAKDAFLSALSAEAANFFKDTRRGKLGQLVSALQTAKVFDRLPKTVEAGLYASVRSNFENTLSNAPVSQAMPEVLQMYSTAEAFATNYYLSIMRELGGVKLSDSVVLQDNQSIAGYMVNDNGDVVFTVVDAFSGEKTEKIMDVDLSLNPYQLHEVVSSALA